MILVVLLALGGVEPQLPPGVTCAQVREAVAQYGCVRAFAWALRQGYSLKEIREAARCLK